MSYSNGDRVKIITENSSHTGELGHITNVYSDQEALLVKLDKGSELGFFVDEVELVQSVGEDGQIFKIAALLHTEPRNTDWTWEQCKENAELLYKAGIRVNG